MAMVLRVVRPGQDSPLLTDEALRFTYRDGEYVVLRGDPAELDLLKGKRVFTNRGVRRRPADGELWMEALTQQCAGSYYRVEEVRPGK